MHKQRKRGGNRYITVKKESSYNEDNLETQN